MEYRKFYFLTILGLSGFYSSDAQSCSISNTPIQQQPSMHVFVGKVVRQITSTLKGHPVYGVEIEPLQEFTQENLRLGRNYKVFPSVKDCGGLVYRYSKDYMDDAYGVGKLVAAYGFMVDRPTFDDVRLRKGLSATMRELHNSCNVNDLVVFPWVESTSLSRCKPQAFQVRRALLALPKASSTEVDHWLLWLADSSGLIDYETIVKEYADPDKVGKYLERRYGDILQADCETLPEVLKNNGASGLLYNFRYQTLTREQCMGRQRAN